MRQSNDYREQILATKGNEFRVVFHKRHTKEVRIMRCTCNTECDDLDLIARDTKNNLIRVYDLDKEGYRSIPLEGIIELQT